MGDEAFERELSRLVSRELKEARDDFERVASMVERLLNAAGLVCAVGAGGDAKGIATMLEGMDGYLYEAATTHAKLGQLMASHAPKHRDD